MYDASAFKTGKTMTKPRICPHCRQNIPIEDGFYFDKDMNMVCGVCDKIVYPVVEAAESEIKVRQKYSTIIHSNGHTTTKSTEYSHYGGHYCD